MSEAADRYVEADYVELDYVESPVYGLFSDYADRDYVTADYYVDNALIAAAALTVSAEIFIFVEGTATLESAASVSADAITIRFILGTAALATEFSLTSTAEVFRFIAGEATLAAAASVTADAEVFVIEADLASEFAVLVQGNFILGASAALDSVSALSAAGGFEIRVDDPYVPYSWDSTGTGSWDDWPNNIWGVTGVTLHGQSSISAAASLNSVGTAQLASAAAVAVTGNHIFAAQAALDVIAQTQTQGNHIFGAEAVVSSAATVAAVGNFILFAQTALAAVSALTGTGGLAQFSSASLASAFAQTIDQTGVNGTAGIRYNASALCVNEAGFVVDQTGVNGTAGILFRAVPVVLEAFNTTVTAGVFIYRDPYRFIRVPMESRVLKVLPRGTAVVSNMTRIISAVQETRVFRVREETRILAEGVPEYDNYRRRKI